MADVTFDSAQGTVNTLLGHLTTILANEARLVRSVHSEVQFIKDEMESMHGFLLHAEEEADGAVPNHQLQAWTKQVKDLAYGSQACVDKYVTSVVSGPRGNGLVSYMLKMPFHLVKTLPARRRIASQIRGLKVRAQEVGERRLRYGVEIPVRKVAASPTTAGKEPKEPSEEEGASAGDADDSNNLLLDDDLRRNLVSGIATLSRPNPFHSEENIKRVSDQLVHGTQTHIKAHTPIPQPRTRTQTPKRQAKTPQPQPQTQNLPPQHQTRTTPPQAQVQNPQRQPPQPQTHTLQHHTQTETQTPPPAAQTHNSQRQPRIKTLPPQPHTETPQQQTQIESGQPLAHTQTLQEQPHAPSQGPLQTQNPQGQPGNQSQTPQSQPHTETRIPTAQPQTQRQPKTHTPPPQSESHIPPRRAQIQTLHRQSQTPPPQAQTQTPHGQPQIQSQIPQSQPHTQTQIPPPQLQTQTMQRRPQTQSRTRPPRRRILQQRQHPLAHAPFKVFLALSSGTMKVPELADKIIKGEDHYSVKKQFECITYVALPWHPEYHDAITERMLSCMWCCQQHPQIPGPRGFYYTMHNKSCLYGKKTLVFVQGIRDSMDLSWLLADFLRNFLGCANGSAIVLVVPGTSLGFRVYTGFDIIYPNPVITCYLEKACDLLQVQDESGEMKHLLTSILVRLSPDDFRNGSGLKMFLSFLYAKPKCTREELTKLRDELKPQFTDDNVRRVMVSCFDALPTHYKGCLMYLTAFWHSSPNHPIRRERVARQWIFHGLLSDKDGTSVAALHQANRCFDTLLDRVFITAMDTTNEGKVKTFQIPKPIMDFLLSLRSTSTGDSSYDKWGHHDQIRELTKRQLDLVDGQSGCFQEDATCRINYLDRDPFRTDELVRDLLASPRFGVVEVLDFQGCRGLKKRHLRGICTFMVFLKYLSIRDTDVEELPSVIENLNYLEMLDIRQTKVRVFTSKVIKVKKLKHLLAGSTDPSGPFFTLSLPSGIGSMSNLQVLSHVHVPKSKSDGMSQLHGLRLRKLGVLLHGNAVDFNQLLRLISEICNTLQSLSIRIEQPCAFVDMSGGRAFKPPTNLQSLSICGIQHELPPWIQELQYLEKVSLRETSLTDDGFKALGELTGLRKLRIHNKACSKSNKLTFAGEQFKSLMFLLIDCPDVADVAFGAGAAPEAQNILWSYKRLQSISGLEHLTGLKEFHLKGNQNNIAPATKKYTDERKAVFKYI